MEESITERKSKTGRRSDALAPAWLLADPRPRVDLVECDGVSVEVVRDDLLHPFAGGNKLRKLDGLLPAVLGRTRDVVTCGGHQSAHTAAVAAMCAERGARARILARGEDVLPLVGNALHTRTFAHEVRRVSRDEYAMREEAMREWASELGGEVVPEGAARLESAFGLVRLVEALSEVVGDAPRTLVVDSGTGTTATGLAIGCAWLGLEWDVVGVRLLTPERGGYAETSARLLDAWRREHGPLGAVGLEWVDRVRPRRFGKLVRADVDECVRFARRTGVSIDPVYTLAAWQHVREMPEPERARVLWVHTGGASQLAGVSQRRPDWFVG